MIAKEPIRMEKKMLWKGLALKFFSFEFLSYFLAKFTKAIGKIKRIKVPQIPPV